MATGIGIGCGISYIPRKPKFDTTAIPNRLWHMRASSVTTVGSLMTIADLSGNGHALLNSGAAGTKPTVGTFPGSTAASLHFDGGDSAECATSILPASGIFTVWCVLKYSSTGSMVPLDLNKDASGGSGAAIGQSIGGKGIFFWKKSIAFDGGPAATTSAYTLGVVFKVGGGTYSSKMYVNGALVTSSDPTSTINSPSSTGFGIGNYTSASVFPLTGDFPESLLISGDASGLMAQLQSYAHDRYGVAP